MSWNEDHVVTQRQQLLFDRSKQCRVVAPGQITAPDGPPEQDISDDGESGWLMKKYNVTRRMAWAVLDLKLRTIKLNDVPVVQPAVWFEGPAGREPKHSGLLSQCIDPVLVTAMRAFDRQSGTD